MGLGLANENTYDTIIAAESLARGSVVPVSLVKAIIATESHFKPNAFRNEPQIGDASRGLMQILLRTAQGVGFSGTPQELLQPAINIKYGVAFLSQLARSKGDLLTAISAYNNGNGRRATKATTVCLAHDPVSGDCIRSYTAQPGEFLNQPYVDKVVAAWQSYGGTPPAGSVSVAGLGTLVALGAGLFLVMRGTRG